MAKTTVRIPVGLPASGKTNFYQSLKENCIKNHRRREKSIFYLSQVSTAEDYR